MRRADEAGNARIKPDMRFAYTCFSTPHEPLLTTSPGYKVFCEKVSVRERVPAALRFLTKQE
jgi:hypothetical protein